MSVIEGTIPITPSQEYSLNVFLDGIAQSLGEEDLERLKFLCSGRGGIQKSSLSDVTTPLQLFKVLREKMIITNENLLTLQSMIWHINRKDLYRKFVDFCKGLDTTLYFYKPTSEPVTEFLMGYMNSNLTYKEIALLLKKQTGIDLSPNATRKRMKSIGTLSKRGPTIHSKDDIRREIERLLQNLPQTAGYRFLTDLLRHEGIHVRRDIVMNLMREIDPIGVGIRRKRRINRKVYRSFGPNHVWHIDEYDKIKPYGFPIHGCIDGYSRKILWLTVGPSNNNPAITAYNFVNCVKELKGCPLILQSDPGTENCIIGAIQCSFRHDAVDTFAGINSHQVVRSKLNQRIEAWWSMLRRQNSDWWINFFKDLEAFGGIQRHNEFHIQCARYCFMPLLQNELDKLVDLWNNHHISASRNAVCPNGRPVILHAVPERIGGTDCLQPVNMEAIELALQECELPTRSGSSVFDAWAAHIFQEEGWRSASNWKDAICQYFYLTDQ